VKVSSKKEIVRPQASGSSRRGLRASFFYVSCLSILPLVAKGMLML